MIETEDARPVSLPICIIYLCLFKIFLPDSIIMLWHMCICSCILIQKNINKLALKTLCCLLRVETRILVMLCRCLATELKNTPELPLICNTLAGFCPSNSNNQLATFPLLETCICGMNIPKLNGSNLELVFKYTQSFWFVIQSLPTTLYLRLCPDLPVGSFVNF